MTRPGRPQVHRAQAANDPVVSPVLRRVCLLVLVALLPACNSTVESSAQRSSSSTPSDGRSPSSTAPDMVDNDATSPQDEPGTQTRVADDHARVGTTDPSSAASGADEREELAFEEALRWWPYRPLLRFDGSLEFGKPVEGIFSKSESGGTEADPSKESSTLVFLYQNPAARKQDNDFFSVLAAGGAAVWVTSIPATTPDQLRPTVGDDDRIVEVRGRQAVSEEFWKRDGANADFRLIYWFEYQPDGTQLVWHLSGDPNDFSENDLIAWGNSLTEIQ